MQKYREVVAWILVIALSVTIGINYFTGDEETRGYVARVENVKISQAEFMKELVKRHGADVVYEIVERLVIDFEANRLAVQVTDREIEREMERFRSDFQLDAHDYDIRLLQEYGITVDQLREDIRDNILLEKLATIDVRVTEADMEHYYKEQLYQYIEPEQLRIRKIEVTTREQADQIHAELQAGADFAATAMEVSRDRLTAADGGDMGFIPVNSLYIEYEIMDEALNLEIGEYSRPFALGNYWAIILVEEYQEENITEFSEVRNLIHRELALKQTKPLNEYRQELIEKLDVEIYEDKLRQYLGSIIERYETQQ